MRFIVQKAKIRLFTLFNLGLHMNNPRHVFSADPLGNPRLGNDRLIQEPWQFIHQQQNFRHILYTLFRAGDTLRVFNTEELFLHNYCEVFAGTNVIYYNKPWRPGTFSNQQRLDTKPSLAVIVSGRSEDLGFRVNEVVTSQIPLINLSTQTFAHIHAHEFQTSLTVSHRHYIHFYRQLIIFLLLLTQKKNLSLNNSTCWSTDEIDFFSLSLSSFSFKKKKLTNIPAWAKKK